MKKTAQAFPFATEEELFEIPEFDKEPEGEFVSEEDEEVAITVPEDSVEVIDNEEEGTTELVFKLDLIPGAEEEIVDEDDEEVVEEEPTAQPKDEWDWETGGVKNFLGWLKERFSNIPKHSGHDTTGIERALAFFKKLDSEISRAMQKDYKREIDAAKAEQARSEIMEGMKRLIERLKKLNSKKFKKAMLDGEFVKIASSPTVDKVVVNVPYLISNIARACIESAVQAGKDPEEIFFKLAKDFGLTKREKYQVVLLIKDMGFPMLLDRVNPFDPIKPAEVKDSEFITQYPS